MVGYIKALGFKGRMMLAALLLLWGTGIFSFSSVGVYQSELAAKSVGDDWASPAWFGWVLALSIIMIVLGAVVFFANLLHPIYVVFRVQDMVAEERVSRIKEAGRRQAEQAALEAKQAANRRAAGLED